MWLSNGSPRVSLAPIFHSIRQLSPFVQNELPATLSIGAGGALLAASVGSSEMSRRNSVTLSSPLTWRYLESDDAAQCSDYSPANWLEWKKHILAQKHSDEDRNSTRRRQEGRLLDELKYSLDQDTSSAGKPVVTVIKKDETMTRKTVQPVQHATHTMPYVQRAAIGQTVPQSPQVPGSPRLQHVYTSRPTLRRQASLPTRPSASLLEREESDRDREREQEFVRPSTPTRVYSHIESPESRVQTEERWKRVVSAAQCHDPSRQGSQFVTSKRGPSLYP
ncbi:hypothetical protein BIW11_13116 [Tropilaelaps mercedesae]|uniref:Uncharacterized protein n=1 Tax=Tropilaelaps mercedesae TaxID=418985 RepID=A0A1V9X3P3_9ACAR|nr:hypothetical protein BIW11_13116 [Tropilaelaps mercedesae]